MQLKNIKNMDYKVLFYWLSVADNAKGFFLTFSILFGAVLTIATICYFIHSHTTTQGQTEDDEQNQRISRKWMCYTAPWFIFFLALNIFTPSRKDALLIVAGGSTMNFLSTDSTARALPKDLVKFVSTELNQMASEANIKLKVNKTKDDILEEAKSMSSDELLKKMSVDSSFRNIILNK